MNSDHDITRDEDSVRPEWFDEDKQDDEYWRGDPCETCPWCWNGPHSDKHECKVEDLKLRLENAEKDVERNEKRALSAEILARNASSLLKSHMPPSYTPGICYEIEDHILKHGGKP